jgi:PTS system nitrogen regulatory IIA component
MKLVDLFPAGRVCVLRAADKQRAIAEVARRAAEAAGLPPGDVTTALAAREALGSTGVGAGIAVPHARLEGLRETVCLFARLERPIDWGAIDRRPVDLVFLLLSPANGEADHLATLAAGTRRLRDAATAAALRAAHDPEALRRVLVG